MPPLTQTEREGFEREVRAGLDWAEQTGGADRLAEYRRWLRVFANGYRFERGIPALPDRIMPGWPIFDDPENNVAATGSRAFLRLVREADHTVHEPREDLLR